MRKTVYIYTDGACSGNPGPGGWGAVLIYEQHRKEISGSSSNTTNNQMELLAAIEAINHIKKKNSDIHIFTDSVYVQKGISEWVEVWQKNNWRNSQKKPVKNKDLWIKLLDACGHHHVQWEWIKGHANHVENERADQLARSAIKKRSL